MPGGALNVLKDLIVEEKMKHPYNEIHIFTLVSDSKTLKINNTEYKITTALPSRLNRVFTTRLDYRNLIVFAPYLMRILSRKINKYGPNEVHISSFAIAKNVSLSRKDHLLKTSLYLHSPMQYIWSHYEEYAHKLKGWKGKLFKRIAPRLRKRDKKFTQFDEVYANSNYTAKLAKEIYGLDAKVKYPQIDMKNIPPVAESPQSYYAYNGRLVKFVKEVDKIIELFNHTGDTLIIIGSGPDENELKGMAKSNIIFIDRMDDISELNKIIVNAKGFINLTKESFGLSTVDALLCGVPVFGFDQGGSAELVDKDSGILVDKKNLHTLISKFEEFKSKQRDRQKISQTIKAKLNQTI